MKYLVIGAGGTGGAIGGFLAKAGKNVTLIARGAHLAKMQAQGLKFEIPDGEYTVPVQACTMEDYQGTPDVIFVCVKGYSLEDTIPFIERVASKETIVISILNIYGTGGRMQEKLPEINVTDGCIYIAAEIKEPGTILLSGKIFRVVYGLRKGTDEAVCEKVMPVLQAVEKDLAEAGITPLLSKQIETDALQKFSFVSPMAAIGAGYDVECDAVQAPGELQEKFKALVREVKALSDAMDCSLPEDIVEINMGIMNGLAPTATASMHRDIRAGKQSELDGLVFEVVRMGERFGVDVPTYREIAARFTKE
ncbi:MAG: 2-dehydropantoate 2-reductase [Lachnospiraceae bacterium]|nr:2-dehydropantoate 2-reductase [Lachnospiraceae bacterium]